MSTKNIYSVGDVDILLSDLLAANLVKRKSSIAKAAESIGVSKSTFWAKYAKTRRWTANELAQLFRNEFISPVDLFRIMKGSADE